MSLTLQAALRAALAQAAADAAHDLAHADRVWQLSAAIAGEEGVPADRVLMASAFLHDLVNLPKDHPDRAQASRRSAKASGPILRALGFSDAESAAVAHAIEAHSFSAGIEPVSIEAKILRDADRLEALGAIGLARCFAVSGALGRALFDGADPFAKGRRLDDRSFAVDHFAVKLLTLPDTMLTVAGRRLAHARAGVLRSYLDQLAEELGVNPSGW
ncbi:MAG: HD domain-containing protein [Rhodobacteraceae bacterium]|nr:HD domain-containing protein [Paracoccaceae bacterium]